MTAALGRREEGFLPRKSPTPLRVWSAYPLAPAPETTEAVLPSASPRVGCHLQTSFHSNASR